MAKPVTKAAWQASKADELPGLLSDAFQLALSGRPGPVLIDIPMDIQRACIEVHLDPPSVRPLATQTDLSDRAGCLKTFLAPNAHFPGRRRHPLRLCSRAVSKAGRSDPNPGDPFAYGRGFAPLRSRSAGRNDRTYGNRWANYALRRADFLLVMGSRLDIRQTGADIRSFEEGKKIWHIDIEPCEINNSLKNSRGILAELGAFFAQPLPIGILSGSTIQNLAGGNCRLRLKWPDTAEQPDLPGIDPNSLMHNLSRSFPQASAFVVDVGQHQMWAAQSLELTAEQRFLTSGGMGSMGFALPAGIGAAIHARDGRLS